jgi:hypothetical protein
MLRYIRKKTNSLKKQGKVSRFFPARREPVRVKISDALAKVSVVSNVSQYGTSTTRDDFFYYPKWVVSYISLC